MRLYRNLACLTALLFSLLYNFSEARPRFPLTETHQSNTAVPGRILLTRSEIYYKRSENPPQPFSPLDTCPAVHFSKALLPENANYRIAINDFVQTPGGDFMMVGKKIHSDGNTDGLFMKIDTEGNILWQRSFDISRNDQPYRIRIDQENNFIVAGFLQNDFFVTRIDSLGNVLWSKQYTDDQLSFFDMIVAADGGIVICGYRFSSGTQAAYLTKLDANGNVSWSRTFDNTGQDLLSNLIETADGYVISAVSAMAGTDGVLMKADKENGDVLWLKKYDFDGRNDAFQQVYSSPSGILVNILSRGNSAPVGYRQIIGKVDNNGNMTSASLLNTSHNITYADLRPTADGGVAAIQTRGQGPEPFAYLYKLGSTDNFLWGKKHFINVTQGFPLLAPTADGDYAISAGLKTAADGSSQFLKTDSEGRIPGCVNSTAITAIIQPVITQAAYSWANTGSGNLTGQSITLSLINESIKTAQSCFPSCQDIQITGKDSVCYSQDTIWYRAVKDATCNLPVSWNIDTSRASILAVTDSTIAIHIKQPGDVQLYASASLPCKIIADTILIYAYDAGGSVELGPDKTICSGSNYILSAGPFFASYRWQDGSTDSSISITAPGKYFVTVIDFCGATYSDTINITQSADAGLDLGLDIIKCVADTVTINAPDGFVKYSWSPAYKTGSTTSRELQVFNDKETIYQLTAERASGCVTTDSIKVAVYQQNGINLGRDTSVCSNSIIPLDAGSGFVSYEWNTGETTRTINIDSAGIYSVKGMDQNGCISHDSITIQQLSGLGVSLGPDTLLCGNNPIVLDAGAGFDSYLWNDGSTERQLTVNEPGVYYVTVTGHTQCGNSDTIEVRQSSTAPIDFLKDTAIFCTGKDIELLANKEFSSYLWNTGATTRSITVAAPGVYNLQVKDVNGCTGADTITVHSRNCANALVFPNAFSPNNDHINELFIPQAPASLEKYHLLIYNRWGQKVFESRDSKRGWDGDNASSQTFIYYCTYKLRGENEKETVIRGTVTLIR